MSDDDFFDAEFDPVYGGDDDEADEVERDEEVEDADDGEDGGDDEDADDTSGNGAIFNIDNSVYSKEIIVVKDENKITSHILNNFEMTEIVSIRATQIKNHNNCMVPVDDLDDPVKMAKRELMMRKTPLKLKRNVGYRYVPAKDAYMMHCEVWNPRDMEFSTQYLDVL